MKPTKDFVLFICFWMPFMSSNVFASSRMVGNAEVAPVDTVAPDTPSDTLPTGTPIQPQAGVEDSSQQETTQQQAA